LKKRPATWNKKPEAAAAAADATTPTKSAYKAITANGPVLKTKPLGKKGQTREIRQKAPRFYSEEGPRHPLPSGKSRVHHARLRKTITPGTILIILAGRFKAHRVVFLKQLDSGLLLVTGPYTLNGVPLRRVNQAYVVATSTKIDISGLKIESRINDKYFKKTSKQQKASREAKHSYKLQVKAGKLPKGTHKIKRSAWALPDSKKADQKAIDGHIIPLIKKTPLLKRYLKARFSLKKGQFPHNMKF